MKKDFGFENEDDMTDIRDQDLGTGVEGSTVERADAPAGMQAFLDEDISYEFQSEMFMLSRHVGDDDSDAYEELMTELISQDNDKMHRDEKKSFTKEGDLIVQVEYIIIHDDSDDQDPDNMDY